MVSAAADDGDDAGGGFVEVLPAFRECGGVVFCHRRIVAGQRTDSTVIASLPKRGAVLRRSLDIAPSSMDEYAVAMYAA